MLIFLSIIAAALVIGDLISRYLEATQVTKRGKLQNKEKAEKGADIVRAEPMVLGTKRNRHYVYKIVFSDGTTYQDVCGIRDPSLGRNGMRGDNERAEMIKKQAVEAHEKEAGEK